MCIFWCMMRLFHTSFEYDTNFCMLSCCFVKKKSSAAMDYGLKYIFSKLNKLVLLFWQIPRCLFQSHKYEKNAFKRLDFSRWHKQKCFNFRGGQKTASFEFLNFCVKMEYKPSLVITKQVSLMGHNFANCCDKKSWCDDPVIHWKMCHHHDQNV